MARRPPGSSPHGLRHALRIRTTASVALAGAAVAMALVLWVGSRPAHAAWVGTPDLTYGSAHTLDDGEVEFGLLQPLQYGISDPVTASIHPILLLIGVPQLAVRWRVTPIGEWTLSLDLGVGWSFLETEDELGKPDDGTCTQELLGFPGTAQLTFTASYEATRGLLLSFGTGFGGDFLDLQPIRPLVEWHATLAWLITPDDLILARGQGYFDPMASGMDLFQRSVGQVVYAHSFGTLSVGVGLAVGRFPIQIDQLVELEWPVYPVLDVWWRI